MLVQAAAKPVLDRMDRHAAAQRDLVEREPVEVRQLDALALRRAAPTSARRRRAAHRGRRRASGRRARLARCSPRTSVRCECTTTSSPTCSSMRVSREADGAADRVRGETCRPPGQSSVAYDETARAEARHGGGFGVASSCVTSTARPSWLGEPTSESQNRAADPRWTNPAMVPLGEENTARVNLERTPYAGAAGSSWSSRRSVGARMKISHMMSGSCWLPLMKPITRRPVASSHDGPEAVAHHLLELQSLLDHRVTAPTVPERSLDPRETAAQQTHDQVVLVVGLRSGGAAAVELLEQPDHPV